VDVLEADDQWTLCGDGLEQLPHCPEGLLRRRRLVRAADQPSHASRHELGLLAGAHQLGDALVGVVSG
jgi:hypothetical protein